MNSGEFPTNPYRSVHPALGSLHSPIASSPSLIPYPFTRPFHSPYGSLMSSLTITYWLLRLNPRLCSIYSPKHLFNLWNQHVITG